MAGNYPERWTIQSSRKTLNISHGLFHRKPRNLFIIAVIPGLFTLICGCNQTSENKLQPATITAIAREVAVSQTASAPSPTFAPTETQIPTLTSTTPPTDTPEPSVVVLTDQLTVYKGPGFEFLEVGQLKGGLTVRPVGRDQECSWIKVVTPFQEEGWILAGEAWITKNFLCQDLPLAGYRPLTGSLVSNRFQSIGKGILEIDNGTSRDSLIVLTDLGDIPQIAVYLQSESQHNLSGIPDGVYKIYFASGTDWDPEKKMFREDLDFQEFSDVINYETLPGRSTQWSLTLQPVEGGTAATNRISDSQFPDLP